MQTAVRSVRRTSKIVFFTVALDSTTNIIIQLDDCIAVAFAI